MTLPKVSCLCPTFARFSLLEEAVESFLRQDYCGPCELIICNDFYRQTIDFTHPRVKVLNLLQRCPSLGSKRNTTAEHATGDWLMTWGDDDIHLPWRITRMMRFVTINQLSFALEGAHFIFDEKGLKKNDHATAGAHIVNRKFFYELGGLEEIDSGEDVAFNEEAARRLGTLAACKDPPAFIYRWHSTRPHISAQQGKNYEMMLRHAESLAAAGHEPTGRLMLQPKWHKDWTALSEHIAV